MTDDRAMSPNPTTTFDPMRAWEYENGFYLTCDQSRIAKLIGQLEVYKLILGVAGDVVEIGVHKGASLMRFAAFRDALETPHTRQLWGFDIFGEFPALANYDDSDRTFATRFQQESGSGLPLETLRAHIKSKHLWGIHLIPGEVTATLPSFYRTHPNLGIALLHLDVDTFPASAAALATLGLLTLKAGIILADNYNVAQGERRAVDLFVKSVGAKAKPVAFLPNAIIIDGRITTT